MATVFKQFVHTRPDQDREGLGVEAFLRELGEISRRNGIGLTDGATLYLMEQPDYAREYHANSESELTFA